MSLSNYGKAGFGYLETIMERQGLDASKLYWKGGFGYLETILERRGLDTLKQYWKGGVWVPWNYIVKARFGYLETILERWGLDTLQQYWRGGVWIPPELKDNLNSSLSFGQAAPMVCLSQSIACLLACLLACLPEAVIKL